MYIYLTCFNRGKTHIKPTILTISKCTYSLGALSTFTLWCNRHHPPSPKLFSFCKNKTLLLLKNNCPFLPPSAPGNHHSTFCFYEVASSRYLTQWKHAVFVVCDWHISPSIMSSRFIRIAAGDRTSFLRKAE